MRISSFTLVKDGSRITDFSKFKEGETEVATTVETFYGEDYIKVPAKHSFSLTYLPKSGADLDWVKEEASNDNGLHHQLCWR